MASLVGITEQEAATRLAQSRTHQHLNALARQLPDFDASSWTANRPRVSDKKDQIQDHIDGMSSGTEGGTGMQQGRTKRRRRGVAVQQVSMSDDSSSDEDNNLPEMGSGMGGRNRPPGAFSRMGGMGSTSTSSSSSSSKRDGGAGGTKSGGGDFANAPNIDMREGGANSEAIITNSFNYREEQARRAERTFEAAMGREMTALQLASIRYYNMSNYAQGVLTGTEPGSLTAAGTIGQPRIIQPSAQLAQLGRNAVGLFCQHVRNAASLRDKLLEAQYYLKTTGATSEQNVFSRNFLESYATLKTKFLSSLGILRWWKDPNAHDAPLNIAYALCDIVPRITCIAGQLQRAVRGQGGMFGPRATVIADRLHAALHEFTDFVNQVRATQGGVWSNFLARDNQPVELDSLATDAQHFPIFLQDIVTYLRQYDSTEQKAKLNTMAGPNDMMVRLALGNQDEQQQIRTAMAEGQASAARIFELRLAEARGMDPQAAAKRARDSARIAAENANPINRYTPDGRVEAQIQGGEVQVVLCVLGERDETGRRQVRRAVQEQTCVPVGVLEAVGPVCTPEQRAAYFEEGKRTVALARQRLADERSRAVGLKRAAAISDEAAAVAQAAKQGQLFRDYVAELQLRVGRLRTTQAHTALPLYPLIMAIFLGIPVPNAIGSGGGAIQLGPMLHHIRQSIMHVRRGNQAVSVAGERAGTSARRARLIRAFIASAGSNSPGIFINRELATIMKENTPAAKRLTREFMIIATLVGGAFGIDTPAKRNDFARDALRVLHENAEKFVLQPRKKPPTMKRSPTPPPSLARRGEGPGSGRLVQARRAMVPTRQGFEEVPSHLRKEANQALQRAIEESLQGRGEGGGGSGGSSSMGPQGGHKGGYRRRTRRAGKRKKITRRAGAIKRKKTRGGRRRRKGGRRRTRRR